VTPLVPPLRIFVSYSHHDQELQKRFIVYLAQLKREGLIEVWHDRLITASTEWAGAIDNNLNLAHIVVLLVSADFLASDYCNDKEMDRALERRSEGVRVVPVILQACDWQTSRFGSFQVLPEAGKPVVDWTLEHGFDDVNKGLRRLIQELCSPAPVPVQVAQTVVRMHPWLWGTGLAILLAGLLYWMLASLSQSSLTEATVLLNVGRYAEAQEPLERSRLFNPLGRTAECGLQAVKLDALRSDREQFPQRVAAARRQYPRCAYVTVLSGDSKYLYEGNPEGALAEYRQAVKREPALAEAYFNMGVVLELRDDADAALSSYKKAVEVSPGTARYHINLADSYFSAEEYDKALSEYEKVGNSPVAAIESAKIHRLQRNLEDAKEREQDAIRWLQDPNVRKAEEQRAWVFPVSPTNKMRVSTLAEKECYAKLELGVTQAIINKDSGRLERCGSRSRETAQILGWELRRLGNQVPEYQDLCDKLAIPK
jgi:tetratricopeptide (TPR) repeat protein